MAQSPGLVGDELDHPYRAHRHVGRYFRHPRTLGHPAAIRAPHLEGVAVLVNRMIGHREIADTHVHPIAPAHYKRIYAREHTAIPSPQIEIQHRHDLWQRTTGVDFVTLHQEHKVAVDAPLVGITRVYDDGAHHAHRHLHHFVGMRVIHEGAASPNNELVNEGLS